MIGLAPKNEMVLLDTVKVEAVEELNEEMAPPPPPPPDYDAATAGFCAAAIL